MNAKLIAYGSMFAAIIVAPLFIAWGFRKKTACASMVYIGVSLVVVVVGWLAFIRDPAAAFGPISAYSPIGFASTKGLILYFCWLASFPTLIFSTLHLVVARVIPRERTASRVRAGRQYERSE